jgi:hypothetical protein
MSNDWVVAIKAEAQSNALTYIILYNMPSLARVCRSQNAAEEKQNERKWNVDTKLKKDLPNM